MNKSFSSLSETMQETQQLMHILASKLPNSKTGSNLTPKKKKRKR